jgi:transcriptional regulator with XRE-family HTH domain
MREFSNAAGRVLRRARAARHLTLHDVMALSAGKFKPSVLGGYERGERTLSIDRFCELAQLYGFPADRLLAEVMADLQPDGRAELVIDLNRLSLLEEPDRLAISELLHQVRTQRRDYLSDVVTLRSGDVEALALERHIGPSKLLSRLRPAMADLDTDHT